MELFGTPLLILLLLPIQLLLLFLVLLSLLRPLLLLLLGGVPRWVGQSLQPTHSPTN